MRGSTNASFVGNAEYITMPTGTSGAIRKCQIAPKTYLYTFIDIISASTGDITIDTLPSENSSCNGRASPMINPNDGRITATVYILNGSTTVKLRVFSANDYIVGSFVAGF